MQLEESGANSNSLPNNKFGSVCNLSPFAERPKCGILHYWVNDSSEAASVIPKAPKLGHPRRVVRADHVVTLVTGCLGISEAQIGEQAPALG
jgi:hypothetical protein